MKLFIYLEKKILIILIRSLKLAYCQVQIIFDFSTEFYFLTFLFDRKCRLPEISNVVLPFCYSRSTARVQTGWPTVRNCTPQEICTHLSVSDFPRIEILTSMLLFTIVTMLLSIL